CPKNAAQLPPYAVGGPLNMGKIVEKILSTKWWCYKQSIECGKRFTIDSVCDQMRFMTNL
ncbi:hypothetical protein ABEB36_002788, partial [Hypothenemus hampei]